ncbi:hypothetical protein BH24ACT5_BH24ACT5_06980 [soil metagenome]
MQPAFEDARQRCNETMFWDTLRHAFGEHQGVLPLEVSVSSEGNPALRSRTNLTSVMKARIVTRAAVSRSDPLGPPPYLRPVTVVQVTTLFASLLLLLAMPYLGHLAV